jgi:TolB-like protein/Tfp pilus assembly protein PilF
LSLFNELQRRNVFRVGAAYVVGAWLLIQVAETIFPLFGFDDAPARIVVVVLMIGFVPALIFAWAFELTPEGLKKESEVDRTQSIAPNTGKKLDRAIMVVLALALGYFAFDKFVMTPQRESEQLAALEEQKTTEVEQARQEGRSQALVESYGDKSIAVLPFVNMSEDRGNEYFADGLSEELLNMMVKIPELRVAARTSSFSFKDKDLTISEIAHELNVSHVLEGSVRKSGNKVRITAQLIKADDGFHLWSENFDRTLDDIFVVQDEIASEVTRALEVTLLGNSQTDHRIDPEAYSLGLKGLYFLQQRGKENSEKSVTALLQAIELEPGYAWAWQLLSIAYYQQIRVGVKTYEAGYVLAMDAIDRALELDPNQGVSWGAYGFLKKNLDWDWKSAKSALTKAHQLDPNSNIIRIWRASLTQTLGRLDEAIELYQQALAVDPLNTSIYSSLGILYRKTLRLDDSIGILEKQIELEPQYHWAQFNLGKSYLFKGEAARALKEIEKNPSNVYRDVGLVLAYTTLGREVEAQVVLQRLVRLEGERNPVWVAEAYAWRDERELAFEWLEKGFVQKDVGLAYILGNTVFENLWDDPRWVAFLQKLNLLEHWLAMSPEYGGQIKPEG